MSVDPAAVGDRIEQLLEASAAAGPVAAARAEELVRLLVDLYGAVLERLLTLADEAGALDDTLLQALAADELVSALLLVHGLHPYADLPDPAPLPLIPVSALTERLHA